MLTTWKLREWNQYFSETELPPMSQEEISESVQLLKDNFYPKPEDCPGLDCPEVRPACHLGICQIAAGMCGDF